MDGAAGDGRGSQGLGGGVGSLAPRLAASYAYDGIARNHPFLDGNKRTAYVAMELFLMKNGMLLVSSDEDSVLTFLKLAAGELSENELTAWIRQNSVPAKS